MKPFLDDDAVKALHITYVEETGKPVVLNFFKMDCWRLWAGQGWTAADLRLVLRHIRKHHWDKYKPTIMHSMLAFDYIIRDMEQFEKQLGIARAVARNTPKPPSARQAALHAVGRREPEVEQVKTPNDIVGTMVTPEDWAKWAQKTIQDL